MEAHRALPLIFLGPSLAQSRAARLCPGEYHGPVGRGDLPRLVGRVPRAVVIIDGQFEQRRAVSPKEIMAALGAGHAVFGAASIGALRAVELERFGMRGTGRIFQLFRSGILTRDDEVAVAYDPATGVALSEPLAGIRIALDAAASAGLLYPDRARSVVEEAAAWPWRERTWAAVARAARLPSAATATLLEFLAATETQKALDAEQVLRQVAAGFEPPVVPDRAHVDLPPRTGPPRPGPGLTALPPAPKNGPWDSTRTVPVEETAARLEAVRAAAGITRVADVTGLDVLGVPNAIAIRPSHDRRCNSAYSGKGLGLVDALVGAQMEALEIACGHDDRIEMELWSHAELLAAGLAAVHPDRLIPLPTAPTGLTTEPLEWLVGSLLRTGSPIRVPADAVLFRRDERPPVWKVSSNGLASGNTLTEAIAHGLAEVIERDAETLFRVATEYAHFPGLLRLVAGPPRVEPPASALAPPRDFPLVDLASLPEPLRGLTDRVRACGIDVALRVITSDVAVPTLLCAFHEPTGDDRRHLVHYGCGTHPDARIAARRAITEAAQSRVTAIQGAREDLAAGAICPADPPADWFSAIAGFDFNELPSVRHDDIRDDIAFMLAALDAAALDEPVVVDLTNPGLGFPVVKVIVPGLELAFHAVDPDLVTLGWRARRFLTDAPDANGGSSGSRRRPGPARVVTAAN